MGEFKGFVCDVCGVEDDTRKGGATRLKEWAVLEHGALLGNCTAYTRVLCPECYKSANKVLKLIEDMV